MRTKELGGGRFALVFDKGDEPMSELERFARERGLTAASFTGIGAFEEVVLTETPAELRKTHDSETGLALIDL